MPLTQWPQDAGANCAACPLSGPRSPVPPEPAMDRADVFIVGESPSGTDEVMHRPFSGEVGLLLNDLLEWQATPRAFAHLTNAMLCKPTVRMSPRDLQKASKCCAPRLGKEFGLLPDNSIILGMGSRALSSLTGHAQTVAWRGYPLPSVLPELRDRGISVFPTFHIGHILRHPHLLPVLKTDIDRFFQWKRGELKEWVWPRIEVDESPDMQDALDELAEEPFVGVDVEAAGLNPFTSDLLCVGLASPNLAVSVPWPAGSPALSDRVRHILASRRIGKVFQNGNFDKISLRAWGIEYAADDEFDTLIAHRIVAPAQPHDLGFIASMELGGPRWKTLFRVMDDRKGGERFRRAKEEPAKFRDMRIYNSRDALMTARLRGPLLQRLRESA